MILSKNNNFNKNFIFSLLLGMIYPIFWIFYLLLPRFFRLDTTRDIYEFIINININNILFIMFGCYYIFPIIFQIIDGVKVIKKFFWTYTTELFYAIHIKLLSYFIYFKFCESFYKIFFIFHDIFAGNPGATWNHAVKFLSWERKIYSNLYFHYARLVYFCIIFVLIFLELIFYKGKIYYSLYLLFITPIILSFFHSFIGFGNTDFIRDVCFSDYYNANFINPRYPRKFWKYMQAPEEIFGFCYKMSDNLFATLNNNLALNLAIIKASNNFYNKEILDRAWGLRYVPAVYFKNNKFSHKVPGYFKVIGKPKSWSFRLSAKYKQSHGVRWYHTSPILRSPVVNVSLSLMEQNKNLYKTIQGDLVNLDDNVS